MNHGGVHSGAHARGPAIARARARGSAPRRVTWRVRARVARRRLVALLGPEFVARAAWFDRAVVLAFAAFTGLAVVGFTLLAEVASDAHGALRGWGPFGPYAALLWTPALTVAILWLMRRYVPGALGSGIPQVVRAIDDDLHPAQRRWLVSPRVALGKIGLVSGGLLAGLSIGREGPTVQVGAGLMVGARRWLSARSRIDPHDLMVAGAAAGIAAAFNTPLGGIVFGLEQLTRRRNLEHSTLVIAVIVLAGLVAVAVFGNETYFGRLSVQTLPWSLWWPGLAVALACGLAGGLFSRLMIASVRGTADRFSRWRMAYPYRFAAGCALAVAVIGLVTAGQTSGAGYAPTRAMLEGQSDLPGVYTLLKFCATWLSAWTGVPAGVFAPSLAIGAGIGHDVAALASVGQQAAIPLIALGMVGFLAATTQTPITAFIIVMEMVAGHSMVLSLMACSMVAAGISRLVTPPLYGELAMLLPLPTVPAPPSPVAATSATHPQPDQQREDQR
jgi:H+/Cl- antiporter ClcA